VTSLQLPDERPPLSVYSTDLPAVEPSPPPAPQVETDRVPTFREYVGPLTLRRVGKLVVAIMLYLIAGELAVRVLNPQEEFIQRDLFNADQKLGFRMVANYRGTMSKKAVPITTNSWGLRDREYSANGEPTLRVYALGDSLIFGYGVPLDQTYTRDLEKLLERRLGRKVQVVNGGVPGYGTLQELAFFEDTVDLVKPDVVVLIFSVLNDATDNVKFAARPTHEPTFTRGLLSWLRTQVREKSQLYMLVRRRMASSEAGQELLVHAVKPPRDIEQGLRLIEESLDRFMEAARRHGAVFGAIVTPAHRQVSAKLWADSLHQYGLSPADYAVDQPNARLAAYAKRQGIPFLDVTPILQAHQQEKLYWDGDGEHWEVRGHEVMAEATENFLVQHDLLPSPTDQPRSAP